MTDSVPTQDDVNIFLDVLRSSGVTNMFGAASYIEDHFNVSKYQARDFLKVWMETFGERREKGLVIE